MTPNQVALLGVVIAGFFGLAGILTTAFGPTWVSWGKKPAFVETVVYKELERDVNLSEALEEQLMHITSYYTSRDLIFDFKQKVNDKIIIVATNTTSVKNVLDRRLSYQHKILFLEDTEIQSVTITAQNSHVTKFGIPELNAKRAVLPDGKVFFHDSNCNSTKRKGKDRKRVRVSHGSDVCGLVR